MDVSGVTLLSLVKIARRVVQLRLNFVKVTILRILNINTLRLSSHVQGNQISERYSGAGKAGGEDDCFFLYFLGYNITLKYL